MIDEFETGDWQSTTTIFVARPLSMAMESSIDLEDRLVAKLTRTERAVIRRNDGEMVRIYGAHTIAEALGCSAMAVSRTLRNSQDLNPKTRNPVPIDVKDRDEYYLTLYGSTVARIESQIRKAAGDFVAKPPVTVDVGHENNSEAEPIDTTAADHTPGVDASIESDSESLFGAVDELVESSAEPEFALTQPMVEAAHRDDEQLAGESEALLSVAKLNSVPPDPANGLPKIEPVEPKIAPVKSEPLYPKPLPTQHASAYIPDASITLVPESVSAARATSTRSSNQNSSSHNEPVSSPQRQSAATVHEPRLTGESVAHIRPISANQPRVSEAGNGNEVSLRGLLDDMVRGSSLSSCARAFTKVEIYTGKDLLALAAVTPGYAHAVLDDLEDLETRERVGLDIGLRRLHEKTPPQVSLGKRKWRDEPSAPADLMRLLAESVPGYDLSRCARMLVECGYRDVGQIKEMQEWTDEERLYGLSKMVGRKHSTHDGACRHEGLARWELLILSLGIKNYIL